MLAALNTLIEIVLYGAIVAGVVMLFDQVLIDVYGWLRHVYYGFSHRQLLRISEGFRSRKRKVRNDRFLDHLDILLKATLKKTSKRTLPRFLIGSVVATALVFVLSFVASRNLALSFIMAFFTLITPYSFLQIRHYHLGIKNSYDIGILINVLVPEYRKNGGSMLHALKATVGMLPIGTMRRTTARLIDRLADYVSTEEARRALDRFAKELGTTWAMQIANDIEHAVVDGVDVEFSLALMHKEYKDIEDARKGQKLARMDSLLVATTPFIFWPVMMGVFYVYLTRNIFYYQFETQSGFSWFIITLVSTLGSFVIGVTFYKPKQDV